MEDYTHSTAPNRRYADLVTQRLLKAHLAGAPAPFQPSSFAGTVAANIPGATYVQWDEMGHFGPLEHPEAIAAFVERTLGTVA